MDRLLDILPIILLAVGQLMHAMKLYILEKEINELSEFHDVLLNALKEEANGTEK